MNNLKLTSNDGTLTASVIGELDHCLASGIRDEIDAEYYRTRPGRLVLDISGITFMDSSGLGLIMGRYTLARTGGSAFSVYGADGRAVKMLEMAGLDKVINLIPAKASVKGGAE